MTSTGPRIDPRRYYAAVFLILFFLSTFVWWAVTQQGAGHG